MTSEATTTTAAGLLKLIRDRIFASSSIVRPSTFALPTCKIATPRTVVYLAAYSLRDSRSDGRLASSNFSGPMTAVITDETADCTPDLQPLWHHKAPRVLVETCP